MCIVIACEILVLNGRHEATRLGVNLKITVQSLLEHSATVFIAQERQESALLFLFKKNHLKLPAPFCKVMWVVVQGFNR